MHYFAFPVQKLRSRRAQDSSMSSGRIICRPAIIRNQGRSLAPKKLWDALNKWPRSGQVE